MIENFWSKRNVIVTGGAGFLGSYVVDKLKEKGTKNIIVPRQNQYDLRRLEDIRDLLNAVDCEAGKTILIHLAAKVGGIGINQLKPAEFFYENLIMGTQLIHESYLRGIEKFVQIGTTCSYPKFAPTPFSEEDLWNGYPEDTNAPYGVAKKALLTQIQAYRQQYGFNGIYLIPVNLYGPRDNFDPETSHVIPAMIKKFVTAQDIKAPSVTLWGDGKATREFLYVADCADGIIKAAELYNKGQPVNLGSGLEISIYTLAYLLRDLTHFEGDIIWDTTKTNGQPRRAMNTDKAKDLFNFQSSTPFAHGLMKTIKYYKEEILGKK